MVEIGGPVRQKPAELHLDRLGQAFHDEAAGEKPPTIRLLPNQGIHRVAEHEQASAFLEFFADVPGLICLEQIEDVAQHRDALFESGGIRRGE